MQFYNSINAAQYLSLLLDNITYYSGYKSDQLAIEQLRVYGKKSSIGSPSYLYQTGLDQLFPISNPESNQNYINFNGFVQYKSLKQNNNIVTGSWNPDVNIFSNEGIGTPEYSSWINEPFNNDQYQSDRYSRLSFQYNGLIEPLQNSGSAYNPISFFRSGFWISLTSNSGILTSGSINIIVNKSYFLESRFSDAYRLPTDIAIYTSNTLTSTYSGSNWNNINLNYYGSLTSVNFSLSNYDINHYEITLDIPNTITNLSYNHFLCLVGSNSPILNINSLKNYTGSVSTKFSILKYLSSYTYYPTISLPKIYDTQNIKTIINTNNNITGLTGSVNTGDIVVLINQNYTGSNGMYVANTGAWLKIDNQLQKQFNFLQSTSMTLTGSKIVYAKNGICFDAIEPQMQIFTYNIDNLNQLGIYNQFQSQPISNIIYSGPIYDNFKLENYSFDLNQPIPAGDNYLKFGYNDFSIDLINPNVTSNTSAICRLPNTNIIEGYIYNFTGSYPLISPQSNFYIISTPSDFAVCKAITSTGSIFQFVAQKVFGSPATDLKVYSSVLIFGHSSYNIGECYNYVKLHEVFECQLFNNLNLSRYGKNSYDNTITINNINNVAQGAFGLEVKSSSYNPNTVNQLAKKYGRRTTGSTFQNFLNLSIKKPFNKTAVEGLITSPIINYLSSDLQYNDKIYEYQKQLAPINGKSTFVTNSLTSPNLGWQEFDFNYLNNQSTTGESSSTYAAINPYFTGPNVVTTTDSFSTRVNTIYNYGNKYNIIESLNNFILPVTNAVYSSFNNSTSVLGPTLLNNSATFWSSFTGALSNGLYLNGSILALDYPTDPSSETNSTLSNNAIYASQGSESDLIFSGQTIFIPLPINNYNGVLQSARIAMKVLGSDLVNGFLRAYIVDLSNFFITNDTYSSIILASSDIVSMNYLNTSYQDVYFSFRTDALFSTRSLYGQIPYLAIQKNGDISSSLISIRCINNPTGSFYQSYSGSQLNSNLQFSSSAEVTTGSNIFALYEYLGDEIYMASRAVNPYTQSFDVVTFPYFDNSSLTVYNNPSDNVPVSYTNFSSTTSLGNIPLSTPIGVNSFDFTTPQTTGSSYIIVGATSTTIFNTRPIGYHLLISVNKQTNDGYPNALQELERNFVYDTQMTPELSLIITNRGGLIAGKNLGPDDASLINASKSSIVNSNLIQRKDFKTNGAQYTFFSPRVLNTGSIDVFSGIRSQQIVDQVFQNNNSQTIIRTRINPTPGMSATIYQGTANGIPTNLSSSIPIMEYALSNSLVNSSNINTYPLLLTVIYINFIATGNESVIRITVGTDSLYRIDNLTSSTTVSGIGPTGTLSISTSTGSQYNIVGYAFGPYAEQNAIKIEYYDTVYNLFSTTNSLKFPTTIQTNYLINPYSMNLTDVIINEVNDTKDDLYRRYVR